MKPHVIDTSLCYSETHAGKKPTLSKLLLHYSTIGTHPSVYKPHWHSSMMVPSAHNAWIQQFSKPSLVSVAPAPNYTHQTQQSPQSSYPPTPPKDDMRPSSENDGAYTPTSASGFTYPPEYQSGAVFKQNTSGNSQPSSNSSASPHSKSKTRARTGTGMTCHSHTYFCTYQL